MNIRFLSPLVMITLMAVAAQGECLDRAVVQWTNNDISLAGGNQASQNDWSGGPGEQGPVTSFGNRFHLPDDVAWASGNLALGVSIDSHTYHLVDDNFREAYSVCAADLDGDGDLDLAGAAVWYDDISWYENLDGDGTQWRKRVVELFLDGARSVHYGDIDSDGDLDLVGAGRYANDIIWVENANGVFTSWSTHYVDQEFSGASWVHSEDMDGDGDADVLGAAAFDDDVTWWENSDGSGTAWIEHVIDGDYNAARVAKAVDFDLDGDMDVATGSGIGGSADMAWYENIDGQGLSWEKHDVSGAFTFLTSATAADMDGDGDTDMVGSATGLLYDGVYWAENLDGSGTSWADHALPIGQYEYVPGTHPVDLDQDGDMDVLGTGCHDFSTRNVIWWENRDGLGTSWLQHIIGPNFEGVMINAADINADGHPDVVCAGEWEWEIAWWDGVRSYKGYGTLESSILDSNDSPLWGGIDWSGDEPAGTFISMAVRSSDDHTAMGPWSEPLTEPGGLEGILAPGHRYLQYKAILESFDSAVTPTLTDVNFDWTGGYVPGNPFIIVGPGASPTNAPLVRLFPPENGAAHDLEFPAYGATGYGVGVSCGDLDGDGLDELLTGAGPGAVYGPHVRGFSSEGTPLPGLSFLAYGTNKWGVNVAAGDIDGDGFAEVVTGAGPGAVFGPHVRAFDYDGTPGVTPVPGVSYFAYGTNKWGVNVAAGDIDGDGFAEIVTGAGPGAVFGPHVRGWNVDGGAAAALPAVSWMAYGTNLYGVRVTCGDLDGDGIDELITAPGPSPAFAAHIIGWNYDGASVTALPGFSFLAWPADEAHYGAQVDSGADLDLDGHDELVVAPGPDPDMESPVNLYIYDDQQVSLWLSLEAFPDGWTHGASVAVGRY